MSTNENIFATKITDNQTKITKTVEELLTGQGYESVGSFISEDI